MRRKHLEFFKTIVIVLLLCSAVTLSVAANLPQALPRLYQSLRASTPSLPLSSQTELTAAARPLAISIRSEAGRQTICRDFEQLDTAYEAYAGYLGEALATATNTQEVSRTALRTALTGDGIYFSYAGSIPLDTLAKWLESEYANSSDTASWFLLSINNQRVDLYFGDGATQYRCSTQLVPAMLAEQITTIRVDGSYFACEADSATLRHIHPSSLLIEQIETAPGVSAASAVTEELCTSIASQLRFNPYGDSAYYDTDGTAVFTESLCSLRITPAGQLSIVSQDDSRYTAASTDNLSLITAASDLLASLTRLYTSDARLYLTGLSRDGTQTTVVFDYMVNGLPIQQHEGHAATVTFSGNAVSTVVFWLRSYTVTESSVHVLPPLQAAALLENDAPLKLEYADLGEDTLQLGWIA